MELIWGLLTTVQGQLERRQRETSHCALIAISITPLRHGFVDVYSTHGHVERMDPTRLPKIMIQWEPDGRKKRGPPRRTWKEGILQP
jgi:hypothetical protein